MGSDHSRTDPVGKLLSRNFTILHVLHTLRDFLQSSRHLLDPVTVDQTLLKQSVEMTLIAVEPFLHERRIGADAFLVKDGFAVIERTTEGGVGQSVNDVDFTLAEVDGLSVGFEKDDDVSSLGSEGFDAELLGAVFGDAVQGLALQCSKRLMTTRFRSG